jgi:hypothetical protein
MGMAYLLIFEYCKDFLTSLLLQLPFGMKGAKVDI